MTERIYCIHCGADNQAVARFCRKCGERAEALDDEMATRVAQRPPQTASPMPVPPGTDREETEVFSISPTLLFVKAGYAAAAVAAFLLVALVSAFTPVPAWIAIIAAFLLFLVPGYHHVRQRLVRYTLTEASLRTDEGLIARTTRSVPLARIQDVTVSAGVFQRLLGVGDLVVDNASEDAGKTVLKNIDRPRKRAEALLKQMRQLER